MLRGSTGKTCLLWRRKLVCSHTLFSLPFSPSLFVYNVYLCSFFILSTHTHTHSLFLSFSLFLTHMFHRLWHTRILSHAHLYALAHSLCNLVLYVYYVSANMLNNYTVNIKVHSLSFAQIVSMQLVSSHRLDMSFPSLSAAKLRRHAKRVYVSLLHLLRWLVRYISSNDSRIERRVKLSRRIRRITRPLS